MIDHPLSTEVELRGWIGCTRIVGAVNLCMAVQAAAALRIVDAALARRGRTKERRGLTLAGNLSNLRPMWRMALVAQERRPRLQHAFRGGAMRVMAV